MSEKQQKILHTLAEVLPNMNQYEKGYMMGTINTAAAMSKKKEAEENDALEDPEDRR